MGLFSKISRGFKKTFKPVAKVFKPVARVITHPQTIQKILPITNKFIQHSIFNPIQKDIAITGSFVKKGFTLTEHGFIETGRYIEKGADITGKGIVKGLTIAGNRTLNGLKIAATRTLEGLGLAGQTSLEGLGIAGQGIGEGLGFAGQGIGSLLQFSSNLIRGSSQSPDLSGLLSNPIVLVGGAAILLFIITKKI